MMGQAQAAMAAAASAVGEPSSGAAALGLFGDSDAFGSTAAAPEPAAAAAEGAFGDFSAAPVDAFGSFD